MQFILARNKLSQVVLYTIETFNRSVLLVLLQNTTYKYLKTEIKRTSPSKPQ